MDLNQYKTYLGIAFLALGILGLLVELIIEYLAELINESIGEYLINTVNQSVNGAVTINLFSQNLETLIGAGLILIFFGLIIVGLALIVFQLLRPSSTL